MTEKKLNAYELGRKAGIDEAVEIIKGMKKKASCGCPPFQPQHDGYCWDEEFPGETRAYNQALDDTTKALQDNK